MYANANGITGKMQSLSEAAKTHNSHVITITETKTKGEPPRLEGYHWISKNRKEKQGGGVAIAIRTDMEKHVTRVDSLEDQDQEILWIEVMAGQNRTYIGTYYGPQENATIEYIEKEYS